MRDIQLIEDFGEILALKESLWQLLLICDQDFYPPLSQREGSLEGPKEYFEGLFSDQMKLIVVKEEGVMIAFWIFYPDYRGDEYVACDEPCHYIKIGCVHPDYRNTKIGSMVNDFIERSLPETLRRPLIMRRTWSTNTPQIRILEKNGYEPFFKLDRDRPGGVSTMYFRKRLI